MERSITIVRNLLPVPEFAQDRPVFHVAPIWQCFQRRHKLGDFLLPVVQCRGRCNDQEGTPDIVHLRQICHERDTLHRLSQTHLVGQDAIDALLIQICKPRKTLELIRLQRARKHLGLLHLGDAHGCRVHKVQIVGGKWLWRGSGFACLLGGQGLLLLPLQGNGRVEGLRLVARGTHSLCRIPCRVRTKVRLIVVIKVNVLQIGISVRG